MSKSAMLRTRRRDVNVKPNRRLDRKSSRGMIYENEELRLRTININAEIERGQSDIKKLRKENEQLRKEIWCLRDEYDKLDRLLKEKHDCTSSSESDSCTSCSESEDPETTQNLENVQKTNLNSLRNDFDHLSVVTEETSAENSDKNSQNSAGGALKDPHWEALPPDMGYPFFGPTQGLHLNGGRVLVPSTPLHFSGIQGGQTRTLPLPATSASQCPRHFFSPLKASKSEDFISSPGGYKPWTPVSPPSVVLTTFTCAPLSLSTLTPPLNTFTPGLNPHSPQLNPFPSIIPAPSGYNNLIPLEKTAPDILIQSNPEETSSNSFINGGNLDELLQDIDNISQDILKISTTQGEAEKQFPQNGGSVISGGKSGERPYKSEISVVLMPKPMPLIGFDKYQAVKSSMESLDGVSPLFVPPECGKTPTEAVESPRMAEFPAVEGPLLEGVSPQLGGLGGKPPENPFFNGIFPGETPALKTPETAGVPPTLQTPPISKKTRKLSIYFKGNKNKGEHPDPPLSPPADAENPAARPQKTDSDNQKSSDSKTSYDKKHRKSSSTSPERRHVHIHEANAKKSHKKRQRKLNRRNSSSLEKFQRDRRSFSVCTDRSNILEHRLGFDEFLTNSERDRSNSLSSCDTIKSRKASHLPQLAVAGKIPWFGCWGNGCL